MFPKSCYALFLSALIRQRWKMVQHEVICYSCGNVRIYETRDDKVDGCSLVNCDVCGAECIDPYFVEKALSPYKKSSKALFILEDYFAGILGSLVLGAFFHILWLRI